VTSPDVNPSREAMLRRIRAALRDVPPEEQPEDVPVPRDYQRRRVEPRGRIIERFAERLSEYQATVQRVSRSELPERIAETLAGRNINQLAVPDDLPADWLAALSGIEVQSDRGFGPTELDQIGAVLTGCALGIAETGTIVLDGGALQGRRAITLVPDYHLCVVEAGQIVGSVPEAVEQLHTAIAEGRPVTFISGPSATSDIELDRVGGVHGPRTLDVLLVG